MNPSSSVIIDFESSSFSWIGAFGTLGRGCDGVLRRDVRRRKTLDVMKLSNPAS